MNIYISPFVVGVLVGVISTLIGLSAAAWYYSRSKSK